MSLKRHIPSALVLAAVVLVTTALPADPHRLHAAPAAQATPAPSSYLETFSIETDHPTHVPASAHLDIVVDSRDASTWQTLPPMTGVDAPHHGPNCEAPMATHDSSLPRMLYEEAVFSCRDHLMTAQNAPGYGIINLTPSHLLDWTDGEAVVRWDMSTFRSSARDWVDLWITPPDELLITPTDNGQPYLEGEPKRSIHIRMQTYNKKTHLVALLSEDHAVKALPYCAGSCLMENFLAPSASRRDTFEVRISRDRIKVWLPQYNLTWANTPMQRRSVDPATGTATWAAAPLDWTRGVVQFGHHSYAPKKCSAAELEAGTCDEFPNTWHWDNLSLSPSRPMALVPARERFVNAQQPAYTFSQPAPVGAVLLVQGFAGSLEASFDQGTTWAAMARRPVAQPSPGHKRTFALAAPAGADRVLLRGVTENAALPWNAQHALLLAADPADPAPDPTPATPEPTPTEEPVPTEEPDPTATPIPPTPAPPTATPAPLPAIVEMDNPQATFVGTWTTSSTTPGYVGANYRHDDRTGKGMKSARYTPQLAAGSYRVAIRSPQRADYAPSAPVTIRASGASMVVPVDQRKNGGQWVDLGAYAFAGDGTEYVEIGTAGTDGSYVVADAVRFERVP